MSRANLVGASLELVNRRGGGRACDGAGAAALGKALAEIERNLDVPKDFEDRVVGWVLGRRRATRVGTTWRACPY